MSRTLPSVFVRAFPAFTALCVAAWVPLAGCKSNAPTYAEDHDSEVRYDCQETVACLMSKGDQLSNAPVDDCIHQSAAVLNRDSERKQAAFEMTFARCSAQRGCEYYACTQADGSYATAHAAEIQKHCTETVACQMAQGQPVAIDATATCIKQTSVTLDQQTPEMRAVFETHLMHCGTLASCAYTTCQ